jgi:hypothetical protein
VLTFAITPALYVDDGPEALEHALQRRADRAGRRKERRAAGISPAAGAEDEDTPIG